MNDSEKLLDLIEKLDNSSVLCVGDVMLDKFVYGAVSRISPEAPVPVCRVASETEMLGGAGNVARNLAEIGVSVKFISVVGDDEAAAKIRCLVNEVDKIAPEIIEELGRQTTIKERFFAGSQQLLRLDREDYRDVGKDASKRIFTYVKEALKNVGALLLSDYGKGVLSPDNIQKLIKLAKTSNCPVVVDPKGSDYRCYNGATVITPNRRELSEASRCEIDDDDSVTTAAKLIANEHRIDNVLVTRSAEGMTLVSGNSVDHLPAEALEVFDVSGAGDTVAATVAAGLAAGGDLLVSSQIANIAAGIVVGKTGTAVASANEIVESLQRQDLIYSSEFKIMSLEAAGAQVEKWRNRGDKIGFTNGCFDLIHPGHLSILAKSRGACDRLVVGLNSDVSVRQLKGRSRPIQTENSRASIMASLASVDLVVLFSEDTPIKLIETIKPDVLAKGADYSLNEVVGTDFVQSYGGKVLLIDLEEGHSTTKTIERLMR